MIRVTLLCGQVLSGRALRQLLVAIKMAMRDFGALRVDMPHPESRNIPPLASRKRCDLKTRKRCDFYSAAQKSASDFSAISSAIFWRFFCGKACDLVLCDLKTQRFFCDCDFLGR